MTDRPPLPAAPSPPEQPAERAWLARTREQLRQAAPAFDADGNWRRIAARIQADTAWQAALQRRPAWSLRGWQTLLAYGLGAATAAAVVLILPLQPPGMPAPPPVAPLGAASPAQATDRVVLQVVFQDETKLADMRAILTALDAEIIAGPGKLGVWHIAVPAQLARAARQKLADDPRVDSVSP